MDELALRAQNGAHEGLVVVANEQTAGRGRAGRSWTGAAGAGLYCSILLTPKVPAERLSVLSLVAGIAVAETIEHVVGSSVSLKWPNDVLVGGKKISGILIHSRITAERIEALL